MQAREAVVGKINDMPLACQVIAHGGGQIGVVFNQQDMHGQRPHGRVTGGATL